MKKTKTLKTVKLYSWEIDRMISALSRIAAQNPLGNGSDVGDLANKLTKFKKEIYKLGEQAEVVLVAAYVPVTKEFKKRQSKSKMLDFANRLGLKMDVKNLELMFDNPKKWRENFKKAIIQNNKLENRRRR